MYLKLFISCLFFSSFTVLGQDKSGDIYRLFFLGGQSNMEGHGLNKDIPDSILDYSNDVFIFHGNPAPDNNLKGGLGKWSELKPGHGSGFSSDGKSNNYSKKFGPELSFAYKLSLLYPDDKIAIIKYARGGSSIDSTTARQFGSWEFDFRGGKGINQFDHFLTTISSALRVTDIDNNGTADLLIPQGIIWMQGESDAILFEEVASRYYSNLKRLMDLIRASFRDDDLPVVIGKISDSGWENSGKTWEFGELVQYAQEKYVKTDKKADIIRETSQYDYSDPYHYDAEGYIDLGLRFADAIYKLNKNDK